MGAEPRFGIEERTSEAGGSPVEREQRSVRNRSRVVLAATIISRGFVIEAKIRNLSRAGAMIEGEIVPQAGSEIDVVRNQDSVAAGVIWSRSGRCGVKFLDRISVEDWVFSSPPETSDAGGDDSERTLPAWLSRPSAPVSMEDRLPKRVGEEIAYVQRLVEAVGRDLSSNPFLQNRHSGSLGSCRTASALLGELARVLTAEDRVEAAEKVALPELRGRLLRR